MSDERGDGDGTPPPGADRADAARLSSDGGEQAVPEYEVEQYLPGVGGVGEMRYQILREKFGYIRAYFKTRADRHADLQRWLNQSRSGTTYDAYLTRITRYSLLLGLLVGLAGIALAWALTRAQVFEGLSRTVPVPQSVALFVDQYQLVFAVLVFGVVGGGLAAGAGWAFGYYYPYFQADARRRNINVMLPHTIVYMYALSFGGMNLVEVIQKTADSEGTYGEVANEFDMIQRDVEVFGNDLPTALRNARNLTPSEDFEDFVDDLLRTMDAGGDVTQFLENETEKYMERVKDEQESFLETLATLSEIFVVAFVAAPLFFIVILMVMSFLGGQTIPQLFAVVYLLLPLGMALFLTLISVLSEPYTPPNHRIEVERATGGTSSPALEEYEPYREFTRIRRRERLLETLRDPLAVFRENPIYAAAGSVPAALAVAGVGALTLETGLTLDTLLADPMGVTFRLGVLPFLVAAVPVSVFHELKRHREKSVSRRFPDVLNVLSSANQMGVQLTDALDLVARESTGFLAEHLQYVSNDVQWNYDTRLALLSLAQRLNVPQVSRSCKIISEGSRSSSDLYRVLSTAAEDTRHRFRIERSRRQEMSTYTTIAVIGFLVYLAVIVIMNNYFLAPIAEISKKIGEGGLQRSGPIAITNISVETYRTIFAHSALIQGIGSGLIAGKLADNQVLSGLKYSIALVLVSLVVLLLL